MHLDPWNAPKSRKGHLGYCPIYPDKDSAFISSKIEFSAVF